MENNILSYTDNLKYKQLESAIPQKTDQISIAPFAVTKFFLSIIFFLFVAHSVSLYLTFNFSEENRIVSLMDKYFNFNNEANFPTLFSSVILLLASSLVFFISKISNGEELKRNKKVWLVLSCIFLFLCVDEATQIHEESVLTVRNRIPDLPGLLYYAWVIPYSFLLLGVVVYFLKFVFSLPAKTRNLFFLSGFLFVFGAIGCELFEGYIEKFYGRNLYYNLLVTLEELLEMVSIVIFIYALHHYITLIKTKLTITFKSN